MSTETRLSPFRRRRVALLAFLASLAFFASYARFGNLTQDEGWLLQGSARVLQGEVPHRDFSSLYVPGQYYAVAAAMALFPDDLLAIRWLLCALLAWLVSLTFSIGARLMPPGYALGAAVTVMCVPGTWVKVAHSLGPWLVFGALIGWIERGGWRRLFATGSVAGLAAWFRQDTPVMAAAAAVMLLAALATSGRRRPVAPAVAKAERSILEGVVFARDAGAVLLGAAVAAGAGLLLVASQVSLLDFFRQTLLLSTSDGAPDPRVLYSALRWSFAGLDPVATRVAPLLCLLPVLLAASVLWWSAREMLRRRATTTSAVAFAVACLALLSAHQLFHGASVYYRFLQVAPPVFLLWFFAASAAAARIASGQDPWRKWAAWTTRVLAFLLPATLVWHVMQVPQRSDLPHFLVENTGSVMVRWHRTTPIRLWDRTFYTADWWGSQTSWLLAFLERNTQPGEPVLILDRPAAAYYLAGRSNPTPMVRFAEDNLEYLGRERESVLKSGCRFAVVHQRFSEQVDTSGFWARFLAARGQVVEGRGPFTVWKLARGGERRPPPAELP